MNINPYTVTPAEIVWFAMEKTIVFILMTVNIHTPERTIKRMSRIVWNDKAFMARVNAVAEKVAEDGAEMVLRDAKRILMSKAKHPTGKLASEIKLIKSKFKGGGYIVIAQPPGGYDDYYAIFVELGTPNKAGKRRGSTEAMPYLRPALHKNKSRIRKRFRDAMK